MRPTRTIRTLALALAILACAVPPGRAGAAGNAATLLNLDRDGVILQGYDSVSFFTDGKPVLGSDAFRSSYRGAVYRFASAEHKAMFDANPARYEPQFGAFCAYAVSQGRTADIDVRTWSLIEGRLVLQHNARAVKLWNEDPTGLLRLADRYWPHVVGNGGKQIRVASVK